MKNHLSEYIYKNYKEPIEGKDIYSLDNEYVNQHVFKNIDYIAETVHQKVLEKLTDKIADDVVNRIMANIEYERTKGEEIFETKGEEIF